MSNILLDTFYKLIKDKTYYDKERNVIVIGELIELSCNGRGSVDFYKYKNLDGIGIDEYDFDSDYITSVYIED